MTGNINWDHGEKEILNKQITELEASLAAAQELNTEWEKVFRQDDLPDLVTPGHAVQWVRGTQSALAAAEKKIQNFRSHLLAPAEKLSASFKAERDALALKVEDAEWLERVGHSMPFRVVDGNIDWDAIRAAREEATRDAEL